MQVVSAVRDGRAMGNVHIVTRRFPVGQRVATVRPSSHVTVGDYMFRMLNFG